jgi:hypothetical protein
MEPDARVPPATSSALARLASFALVVAAALFVFCGALGYFFSQDDFIGIGRVRGLVPRLEGPWRWVSNQAFFDVLWALARDHARVWHAASLLVHVACAGLLLVLLARRMSLPAAFVGAAFFATHPSLYTALYWIAAVNDSLALLFALAAWLIAERRDMWRWAAVPAFVLSVLSKETTILLPLVLALDRAMAQGPDAKATGPPLRRGLDPIVLALGAVAAAYVAYFFAANIVGVRGRPEQAAAYAVVWGPNLWQNALTYLGWTTNFVVWAMRTFRDAVDPDFYTYGAVLLVLWLVGLRSQALRKRGWLVGGALYVALLAPVLPLKNHTYHYYLYAPLAGAAWCLAAAADAFFAWLVARATQLAPRSAAPRSSRGTKRGKGGSAPVAAPAGAPARARSGASVTVWTAAGALAALFTASGAAMVREIETHPFIMPGLRADATVDRALIAERVIHGLRDARLPRGTRLVFFSPAAVALEKSGKARATGPDHETYWERNVRVALENGVAVRALVPEVGEVRFVREYRSLPPPYRYVIYEVDGRVRVANSAEIDSSFRAFEQAAGRVPER